MVPMQNNPLMMLVQAMNSGQNPMALLQQMARNMAGERGIDINQMMRQLGINNASRR